MDLKWDHEDEMCVSVQSDSDTCMHVTGELTGLLFRPGTPVKQEKDLGGVCDTVLDRVIETIRNEVGTW